MRRQCKHCPWKKSTNPNDIPGGYSRDKHCALSGTVAKPGDLNLSTLRIMACHESPIGREKPCVGWLHQQLGEGNNIGLRLAVMTKRISADYELVGEQHTRLEDTLPRDRAIQTPPTAPAARARARSPRRARTRRPRSS